MTAAERRLAEVRWNFNYAKYKALGDPILMRMTDRLVNLYMARTKKRGPKKPPKPKY